MAYMKHDTPIGSKWNNPWKENRANDYDKRQYALEEFMI